MGSKLPVDAVIPELLEVFRTARNVVVEAPPGAGKTTRIPPRLLGVVNGDVLVLEPRRIAARMAARRVAEELGESLGETVGYQVRFEEVAGPRTRLRFLTEGVFTRRLLRDPLLRGVDVVVLDEFHERHLEGDLALSLLRRLQCGARPNLRVVVMSATLDAGPLAEYLGGCPVVRSEGRLFDIDVSYTAHSNAALEDEIAAALERLGRLDGDLLVFLPGAAEIRKAMRACEGVARRLGLLVLPLHGDLPPDEQDRAVQPASQPKVILSTNVAESSITIDGVTTVIDSGLARIASDSPSTGLPTLEVRRVSKASAIQRAGRAGRTRPGRAVRLYSLDDFVRRPDFDVPEIRRRDLSQALVELRAIGVSDVPWFETPPAESMRAAEELLARLGASAKELARYPLHPRLSRLLVEAGRRGVAEEACRVAALLSSGDRLADIDVLEPIDGDLSFRVRQIERQVRRIVRPVKDTGSDDDVRISLLAAYPDRVGRRRSGRDVRMSNGKPAVLMQDFGPELLVAVDVEDRKDAGAPVIRAASALRADWLLDLFPDRVAEREEVIWNRTGERVESRSSLLYDDVVIDESTGMRPDPEKAGVLLAEKAIEVGLHRFADVDAVEALLARIAFASQYSEVREPDVQSVLAEVCAGLRSFAELKEAAGGLLGELRARAGRGLDEVAPERVNVNGRQVRVNYERGKPPWMESRLQDFFGMKETPRVARGAVPVVVHLLAPNRRPVQTTTDLAGFWERLYPQVRRELSRRYPKHAWPERVD